jgi:hypothetical protein
MLAVVLHPTADKGELGKLKSHAALRLLRNSRSQFAFPDWPSHPAFQAQPKHLPAAKHIGRRERTHMHERYNESGGFTLYSHLPAEEAMSKSYYTNLALDLASPVWCH